MIYFYLGSAATQLSWSSANLNNQLMRFFGSWLDATIKEKRFYSCTSKKCLKKSSKSFITQRLLNMSVVSPYWDLLWAPRRRTNNRQFSEQFAAQYCYNHANKDRSAFQQKAVKHPLLFTSPSDVNTHHQKAESHQLRFSTGYSNSHDLLLWY